MDELDTLNELRYRVGKALGWKWYRRQDAKCPHCGEVFERRPQPPIFQRALVGPAWVECDEPQPDVIENMLRYTGRELPYFGSDIAAAWELVEDAEEAGLQLSMDTIIPKSGIVVYEFRFHDGTQFLGYGSGFTAPEAICNCWLDWKGETK